MRFESKVIIVNGAAAGIGRAAAERVNAVCPAPIETRMMRAIEQGASGRGADDAPPASLEATKARFITGSVYTVDGGMTPQ